MMHSKRTSKEVSTSIDAFMAYFDQYDTPLSSLPLHASSVSTSPVLMARNINGCEIKQQARQQLPRYGFKYAFTKHETLYNLVRSFKRP